MSLTQSGRIARRLRSAARRGSSGYRSTRKIPGTTEQSFLLLKNAATRVVELAFFFAVFLTGQGINVQDTHHAGSQEDPKACGIISEYVLGGVEGRGATEISFLGCAGDECVEFAITGPPESLVRVNTAGTTSHYEPALAARNDIESDIRGRSEDAADSRHRLNCKSKVEEETRTFADKSSIPSKQDHMTTKNHSPFVSDFSFSPSKSQLTTSSRNLREKSSQTLPLWLRHCQGTEKPDAGGDTNESEPTKPTLN